MRIIFPSLFFILVLVGCSDSGPEIYEVPKESADSPSQQDMPPQSPFAGENTMPPQGDSDSMAGQTLPDEALNQEDANPDWEVPESWSPSDGSSMRRASFSAPGPEGNADVAVTSFPGDVGGLLANVNRWRNQIGLSPITEENLDKEIERLNVNGKEVILLYIENEEQNQATEAAIFNHEDNSWFFKMTGPTETVENNASDFRKFVKSVKF